jgi:hypothetical protein
MSIRYFKQEPFMPKGNDTTIAQSNFASDPALNDVFYRGKRSRMLIDRGLCEIFTMMRFCPY